MIRNMRHLRLAPTICSLPSCWPIVLLVFLPAAVFTIPALVGHPTLPGDDLTQNYPLRVLAGEQIRSGHLPVFNPFIWSGAPLLGGWNAGAAYPLTLLFAVLPGTGAWTLNLVVTWSAAGLSTYFLCRGLRLGALPSFLAALSFSYAGAMSSQIVHFGLVTGIAWLPLQVLAIQRLANADSSLSRLRWAGVLAVAIALTFLAGEPRAIDDALLVVVLFAAWTVARLTRQRLRTATAIIVGVGLGVCCGALQWLPGTIAVSTSQRAVNSASLFTSGSLPLKWLLLVLEPDLLGGTGSLGEPHFVGSYSLLEVTGYVGIFPVIAAAALLARLRRRTRPPDWLVWHVVAAIGVILALGGSTPAWHVLIHVPLFGGQRLQSRNLLVVDFALAILLAYWANDMLTADSDRRHAETRRREDAFGIVPPVVGVITIVLVVLWADGFERWLAGSNVPSSIARALGAWQLPFLLVDVLAILWILYRRRLSVANRALCLTTLISADIVVFTVFSVAAVMASPQAAPGPVVAGLAGNPAAAVRPISSLGYPGRFAIYNPDQLQEGNLAALGSPDLNLLTRTPSIQGYSAIVDGNYASLTGSHIALGNGQDTLAPKAISNGTLDQLDDSVLVTLPQYLLGPLGARSDGTSTEGVPEYHAGDEPSSWYFGETLPVTAISLTYTSSPQPQGMPQIGLLTEGAAIWLPGTLDHGRSEVRLGRAVAATAVLLRSTKGSVAVSAPSIVCGRAGTYSLDGPLQGDLSIPHWGYAGADGPFAVFVNHRVEDAVRREPAPGKTLVGTASRVLAVEADNVTSVEVSSPGGVRIARSVAAIPGWRATWTTSTGEASSLPVRTAGVIQVVTVPPGHGVLAWSYDAPGLDPALALTVFGTLATACLLIGDPRRRSRRSSNSLRRGSQSKRGAGTHG